MPTVSAEYVAAVLITVAAVMGCGSEADRSAAEPSPRGPATIDERAGTYRGVGIGSTREEAQRQLGRLESGPTDPLAPVGERPLEVGLPPAPQDPRTGGIDVWRFDDVAMAAGEGRAWLVTASAEDVVTSEGVGVGSELDDVRAAYPDAECDTANKGGEYTNFEFCTLQVAPERYLWFGYDPVRSVTMSRLPLR